MDTSADTEQRRRPRKADVLDAEQAASYLGCSESMIRKLFASGELRSFRVGSLRRTRRADLDDFIQKRVAEEGADRI